MKITFLGTSSMQPTKDRNVTSILLNHNSENILIDCGEGTQRQLFTKGISPTKITKIFITHWHGDHILGLPGLIMTLKHLEYSKRLEIYGPKGTKKYIKMLSKYFIPKFLKHRIRVKIKEITKQGKFLESKDLEYHSFNLEHSMKSIGYVIKEKDKRKINVNYTKKFGLTRSPILRKLQEGKNITYKGKKILASKATKLILGKKISFVFDTVYFKGIVKPVKNSDILVIESTLASDLKDRAKIGKHLTTNQAAKIAKDAKVKKVYLTHISKRYKDDSKLLKEAKKIFKNTVMAKDFMEIKL